MSEWSWAAVGAAVGGLVTGFFAWLVQKAKGDSDLEVTAVGEWQKLYAALSSRLAEVEAAFADYRTQMAAEMKARDDQITGLVRMIAQDSQSTARLISASPVVQPKDATDGR